MGPMDKNKLDRSLFWNHFPIIWVIPKKDPLIEAKNVTKKLQAETSHIWVHIYKFSSNSIELIQVDNLFCF